MSKKKIHSKIKINTRWKQLINGTDSKALTAEAAGINNLKGVSLLS